MNEKTVSGFHALAVAVASSVVAPAFAQSSRWRSADVIAGADHYDPPRATALAAKLSRGRGHSAPSQCLLHRTRLRAAGGSV